MKNWKWYAIGGIAFLILVNSKKANVLNLNQGTGKIKMNETFIDRIKNFIKSKHKIDFSKNVIFGIRGADIVNGNIVTIPNIRNQFNDLIGIIKNDEILVYKGNLEPGNPAMLKPIVESGTFQISDGFYKVVKTTHGRDIVRNNEKIRIREKAFNVINAKGQRDKNRDKIFDSKDPVVSLNPEHGINIHPTNRKNPINVDHTSYGCINLKAYWEDQIWNEFRDTLYNDNEKQWDFVIFDSKNLI